MIQRGSALLALAPSAPSAPVLALLLALLPALMLAGCATLSQNPVAVRSGAAPLSTIDAAVGWPARRAAVLAQQNFALQGRVAIVAAQEGFSAGLRWSQRAGAGEMQLNGPLGVGALRVQFDESSLQVTDARGAILSGAAARAELERRLGFELPLAQLGCWARGVASPTAAGDPGTEKLDAAGQRLATLDQDGWHMDYSAYAASSLGVLPQKLELRRADVRIRLAIQKWELP